MAPASIAAAADGKKGSSLSKLVPIRARASSTRSIRTTRRRDHRGAAVLVGKRRGSDDCKAMG